VAYHWQSAGQSASQTTCSILPEDPVPTYQYACTECGHAFEQVQSFTDDALTECPECRGRLRKVFNAVGVVFKGSGFYRTDSRAGSSATVPAASSDSPAKSDSPVKTESAKSSTSSSSTPSATPA
jgi:putative FmdB family regulatory protein